MADKWTPEKILEKLAELLNSSTQMSWLPIDNGRQQSSYQEFTITIDAGGSYILNNPFNYFRCLEANQPFKVAWSTNNGQTNFQAGLGVKFDQVIPYVQIFNPSGAPLVVSIGVGIGYFDDSRLSVSGTVQTEPAPYSFFGVETVTFGDTGQLVVNGAQKVIIQNTGTQLVYVGGSGTNGLQLQPQGTFEYSLSEPLTIYGTSGQTVTIGSFS